MSSSTDFDTIPLNEAVLCVDCEVITASASDTCPVCGSRSLLCLSRVLGGIIEGDRAVLFAASETELPDADTQVVVIAA